MSRRSLRARLDRLEQLAIPEIGKDRDRDRRRCDELFSRRYTPGLTLLEEEEYTQLRASFEDENPEKGRALDLVIRRIRGEPLTDAEQAELAEHDMRPIDPKDPLAPSIEAFRAELARRREGKN